MGKNHLTAVLFFALNIAVYGGTFTSWCGISPWLRDNVFTRIDVQDGALKIDSSGSFKVYVASTMYPYDGTNTISTFYDVHLKVISNEFDTTVTHSPTWTSYPDLPSLQAGGSAQYFTVNLKRKTGIPDGYYAIEMELYSSKNNNQRLARLFTVSDAQDIVTLQPANSSIAIDGNATAEEWGAATLCNNFRSIIFSPQWLGSPNRKDSISVTPRDMSRVRICSDQTNLYVCMTFMGAVNSITDTMSMYIAPGITSASPVCIKVNGKNGALTCTNGTTGIQNALDQANNAVEIKISKSLVGISGTAFCLNFVRKVSNKTDTQYSFWRGNGVSYSNPIVFAQIATQ